jgi:hypothetical protein
VKKLVAWNFKEASSRPTDSSKFTSEEETALHQKYESSEDDVRCANL